MLVAVTTEENVDAPGDALSTLAAAAAWHLPEA
jgi:hypothetical protein